MSDVRTQRRLMAIIAADVVGYSKMMGRDEAGTLARLKALRSDFLHPKIGEYGGRLVKTTGDGSLIEFASAVDAVAHAVDVQRGLATRNQDVPEERRITLRLGINVGDIIIDEDDIYGDGVNVAARLEALAEPGGICVSARVFDHVHRQIDVGFDDLGDRTVKNIAEPVHVYRVRLDAGAAPRPAEHAQGDRPTVAVLPFDDLSTDPARRYFADGLTEDLITALCRVPDLLVIARNSSAHFSGNSQPLTQIAEKLGARHLLHGSVQSAGSRLRVTAQLVDGRTGNYVWSDRYDRAVDDIFAVQDDIVKSVLVELQVNLTAGEAARVAGRGTDSLEAWLLHLRGWNELMNWNRESTLMARKLAQAAVAADPDWGLPKLTLAISHREFAIRGWGTSSKEDFRLGLTYAELAAEATPDDPFVLSQLGETYVLLGRVEEGVALSENALALAPSDSRLLGSTSMNLVRAGRFEQALRVFATLRRVCPLPFRFVLGNEGLALHMLGRHDEAAALFKQCDDMTDAIVRLAALEADRDRLPEAKRLIARVLEANPKATVEEYTGNIMFSDGDRAAWYDGLLKSAGLPTR